MASAFGHAAAAFGIGKLGFLKENWFVFGIVAILNFILLIGVSAYGIGLNVDSANYFSVAQNLARGFGFLQFDGFPFLNAPPLYSLMLAPAYLLNLNPFIYAIVLQLVFFNVSIFYLHKIIENEIEPGLKNLVFWVVAGSYFSYLHVFIFALSEAGFVSLLLPWTYYVLVQNKQGNTASSILFALMSLQRYSLWLMLPGVLFFWFKQKRNLAYIFFQIAPTIFVSAIWWMRNYLIAGNPIGEHALDKKISFISFLENLQTLFNGVLSLQSLFAGPALFLICLLIGIISLFFYQEKRRPVILLVVSISLSLFLFLMLQQDLSMVQLPRYLSILWLLVLLLPILGLNQLRKNNKFAVAFLFLIAMMQTIAVSRQMYLLSKNGAGGYNSVVWKKQFDAHPLVLSKMASFGLISNYPDIVWWVTGKPCVYTPFKYENKVDFYRRVGESQVLIWFNSDSRNEIMNTDFIHSLEDFQQIDSNSFYRIGFINSSIVPLEK
jgi:hypothetical protein